MKMKRTIISLIALLAATLPIMAQSYRGFVELEIGYGVSDGVTAGNEDAGLKNMRNTLIFGFATTHGCQVTHNLFVGAGLGAYGEVIGTTVMAGASTEIKGNLYAVNVPVYASFRWDFDWKKKINPFVSLNVGYQFVMANNDAGKMFYAHNIYSNASEYVSGENTGYIYLRPAVGFRIPLNDTEGFSFGFSYNVFTPKKFTVSSRDAFNNRTQTTLKSIGAGGALMLNFALDF